MMIRRHLPIVLTILAIGILSMLFVLKTSPRVYEASAVIQFDAPVIADNGSEGGQSAERRVQLIEQRLMVRSNLLDVINRLQLYTDMPLSESEKIDLLRQTTRIESVATPGRDPGGASSLAAVVITTQSDTAQKAAALANDFADSVVNSDENNRKARLAEAATFLTDEESRLQKLLGEQDQVISDFTTKHQDSLPSSQQFVQTELTTLSDQDGATDRDIRALERERLGIFADAGAEGAPAASLVQQLRQAEAELSQAKRLLPADHPEVLRLQDNIRQLAAGGISSSSQTMSDQVNLIELQLTQLRDQKAQINARQAEIEDARNQSSAVNQEYQALLRDQQRLRDRFSEISRRLAEVETQQSLQQKNLTDRFVVLERAVPPEYPALGGRKKKAVLGAFVSFLAAVGIGFLLELRKPILHSGEQFERVTGLRPVASLLHVPSRAEEAKAERRRLYVIVVTVTFIILALWIIGLLPGIPSPGGAG